MCGFSVEEAKKKMYACSTTTYTGFQAVMTEEESKKFEGICSYPNFHDLIEVMGNGIWFSTFLTGLPGVIFVLPDSYIDPVNKQYGGKKSTPSIISLLDLDLCIASSISM